jgi:cytidylate kinase
MTVITISRQYGSGGDQIADRLCKILGYQQFDKQLVIQAAVEAGISETEIYDYSEENHRVRSFLDRLFSRTAVMGAGPIWGEVGDVYVPQEIQLSEDMMQSLVQKAIRSAHQKGNMIILGRGSQVVLQNEPDTLHVRLEAPLENRIQTVKEWLKAEKQTFQADVEIRREAQDLIVERDAASRDYIKRFFQADWANPILYHVVLNTGKLSLERATELIVDLVTEF